MTIINDGAIEEVGRQSVAINNRKFRSAAEEELRGQEN
jgi:hypothetical protein